jgi:hypothetical protein
MKDDWIGHVWHRNCLLKHFIEGKKEGLRRRGRRHKQLIDDLQETRRYWQLEKEALDCCTWRTLFGGV